MAAKMTPKEALQALNSAALDGTLDVIAFLEQNYLLEGGFLRRKAIKFESWQIESVLLPVIQRVARGLDSFLIGLPKKNGKSTLASVLGAYGLLLDDPAPEVYSFAFDKDQARIIFEGTKKAFERSPGLRPFVRIFKDVIERIDGAGYYRVLASDESGTHGINPSCVILDEAWNQGGYGLYEALVHSPARAHPFILVTSYAGYQLRSGNLLADLYSRGLRADDPRMYMFWRNGADANLASWITPAYLESERLRLPEHIYRRLHLNEWSVDEATRVFRIPAECWQGFFQDPLQGSRYAVGVDLAKYRDFSAVAILRTDVEPYRLVDFCKLPHADYTVQVQMIVAKIKRFECPNKVKVLVDVGAAGPAVAELLRQEKLEIEEFRFTSESKSKIVTELAIAFEQRKIVMPQAGRTPDENRAIADLEGELFNFEPTVLKSGNVRYEAAGGYHDDLVTALCLAYAGASVRPRGEPHIHFLDLDAPPRKWKDPMPTDPNDPGPSRWWRPL